MLGRKGMLHYRVEIRQESVRQVLEAVYDVCNSASRLEIRKAERIKV